MFTWDHLDLSGQMVPVHLQPLRSDRAAQPASLCSLGGGFLLGWFNSGHRFPYAFMICSMSVVGSGRLGLGMVLALALALAWVLAWPWPWPWP